MASLHSDDSSQFARLSQELLAEEGRQETLQAVVERAVATIPGVDLAGITVIHRGRASTPAATDPLVEVVDGYQYELGEGPCLSAITAVEHTQLIPDIAHERRWSTWCQWAAEQGILSSLSVRLETPQHMVGALNLYSKAVDSFDADAVLAAEIFAMHASSAVSANEEAENLTAAMKTRHQIGVAQGMLMNRYGLDEEQAFRFLARTSQDNNVKLREVALRVIEQLRHDRG